jgi:hypothetical protein
VTPGSDLLLELERDLSVCTFAELQERWGQGDRNLVIADLARKARREVSWEQAVPADHNPIYYTAERAYFSNKKAKGNPRFLYAPYHRDRFCKMALEHILSPPSIVAALLILALRYSYKSTFTLGVIPMWFAHRLKRLLGHDARIVLRHHKEEMASGHLVRLKDKYRFDPWTRRVWHDACPAEGRRDFGHSTAFSLPWIGRGEQTEVTFRAIGVSACDTGAHGDLDCGDDIVTEEHLKSKLVRRDSRERYEARTYQSDDETREMNTGTPYHPEDTYAWMEKALDDDGTPIYRVVKIPAIAKECPDCKHPTVDDKAGEPNHLRAGKCTECGCESTAALTHPFKCSWDFLNRRRKQEMGRSHNDSMWRKQYQIQLRAESDMVGDSSWLREATLDDIPENAWPVLPVDPAWKGTANAGDGDAAAGQMWFMARRAGVILRYLVDGFHSRLLSSNEGTEEMFRLMQKWNCRATAPEEHGGQEFRQKIRDHATALGYTVTLIDLKLKQTAKWQRMLAFLREAEKGTVFYVPETVPPEVLQALRDQMDGYHPEMDDDDALDCAGYSMDPNIAKNWAPAWNSGQQNASASRRPRSQEVPRTRHCSL